MAILKNIQDSTHQVYEYHKVANVRVDTYTMCLVFEVHSYKDLSARNDGASFVMQGAYSIELDLSENLFWQAYNYLKTTQEFSNSLDIL